LDEAGSIIQSKFRLTINKYNHNMIPLNDTVRVSFSGIIL
jgi:hypothetical protein